MLRIALLTAATATVASTLRALRAAGHSVDTFYDGLEAFPALIAHRYDVLITEWGAIGRTNACELVRRLRTEETEHLFVILYSTREAVDGRAACAAGIDDFVSKPLAMDELLVRLGGAIRLRQTVQVAVRRSRECDVAHSITRLSAWARLQEITGRTLDAYTSLAFAPAEAEVASPETPSDASPNWVRATIPFSLAEKATEVRFFIEADMASVNTISNAMFGEAPPEEALPEVVLEMLNTVGGAFMREVVDEGIVLTSGLPAIATDADFEAARKRGSARECVVFETAGARVRITAVVATKPNVTLEVTRLREGMIVVTDLHTVAGALLVPGGTRLTSTVCERVARILAPDTLIKIADAA